MKNTGAAGGSDPGPRARSCLLSGNMSALSRLGRRLLRHRVPWLLAISAAPLGCARRGHAPADAAPVEAQVSSAVATVFFIRPPHCGPRARIVVGSGTGEYLGELARGKFFRSWLTPGRHELWAWARAASTASVSADVVAGQNYFVALCLGADGQVAMRATHPGTDRFSAAASDLRDTEEVVPDRGDGQRALNESWAEVVAAMYRARAVGTAYPAAARRDHELVATDGVVGLPPLAQLSDPRLFTLHAGAATVILLRPPLEAARREVRIGDGSGDFVAKLAAGQHAITRLRAGSGVLWAAASSTAALQLDLAPGKLYFVHVAVTASGDAQLLALKPQARGWEQVSTWLGQTRPSDTDYRRGRGEFAERAREVEQNVDAAFTLLRHYRAEALAERSLGPEDGVDAVPNAPTLPVPAAPPASPTPSPSGETFTRLGTQPPGERLTQATLQAKAARP